MPVQAGERIFALVLALLGTRAGLTKHEILSRVTGYREDYVVGGKNDAVDRRFERDKELVREAGIPLEVAPSPTDPDNNQEARYRIQADDFARPTDVEFSAEERSLLNLAALVWRGGGLSDVTRLASLKLRADPEFRRDAVASALPRQRANDRPFPPIARAIERGMRVEFDYLKPGEATPTKRRVQPWALVLFRGRWMLTGFDLGRDDQRTFQLTRIVSDVRTKPDTFVAPEHAGDEALEELEQIWQSATARVRVVPGSDAEVRLAHRLDTVVDEDVYTLHHADANLLADELAGFGPDVVVLGPERVRTLVLERLHRLTQTHTDGEA